MSNNVKKIYLCRPNLSPICYLNGVETDSVSINKHVKDFDELTFVVDRYINIDGKMVQSSGYEMLNVAMYLHVQDYGYFRMEYPTLRNDGTKQTKEIMAYSAEKEIFNTDWVGLKINTAEEDSQEMLIDGNVTDYAMPKQLISFHNPYDPRFSLLNILISKTPLWSVGYVDPYIYTQTNDDGEFIQETKKSTTGQDIPQTFTSSGRWEYTDNGGFVYDDTEKVEPKYKLKSVGIYQEENISIYAFLTSDLGPKIGCLFFFDTENRLIHAVSKYSMEHDDAKYDTGIYVGFRNLANSVDLAVEEDSVVTRVNCEGGEGLNFLDLNYGSTRLYNFSYFAHEPYMTEATAQKVLQWQELIEEKRAEYKALAEQAVRLSDEINDITYKVPADENYWKTWDGMNEEGLNKSLAYYLNELSMLQESVDDTPMYDEDGKYIPYNQDKTDEWYEDRLIRAENGYGGYGTYYELVTYIIPNIRIAINNLRLVATDPNRQAPIEAVKYDWDLYGIVELQNQIKNLQNQFDILKNYYGVDWPSVQTPQAAAIMGAHAWNKEFYNKQREQYKELNLAIGENGTAFNYLDYLYLQRDGTDRNGVPVSEQAVQDSLNGRLDDILEQMAPYKSYYDLESYFTEEELSQLYPLMMDTDYSNTNIQMQETDTALSKIDVEQELLDDCIDKVSELSQPQITFSSELDNLYRIEQFSGIKDDLKLLNYIHLAIRDDYVVKLRVVGISWNPCDIDSNLTIEFSNMITSRSGRSDFTDIINSENNRGQKNGISIGANGQIGGSGDSIDYLTNLMQALSGTGIFKKKVKDTVQNPVTGITKEMVTSQEFMASLKTVPGMSRFVLDQAQIADLDANEDTIISGGKVKTGFINARYIAVTSISSHDYDDGVQSVYSDRGLRINLSVPVVDQQTGETTYVGTLKAPNFAIDENGNAFFRGQITAGATIRGATLIGSEIKNAEQNPTFTVSSDGTITSTALIDPEDPESGTWSTVISGGSLVSNHITGSTIIASTIQNAAQDPSFSVTSQGVITSTGFIDPNDPQSGTASTIISGGKITSNNVDVSGAITATSLSTGGRTSASTGTDGIYINSSGDMYIGSNNQTILYANGNVSIGGGILTYSGLQQALKATNLDVSDLSLLKQNGQAGGFISMNSSNVLVINGNNGVSISGILSASSISCSGLSATGSVSGSSVSASSSVSAPNIIGSTYGSFWDLDVNGTLNVQNGGLYSVAYRCTGALPDTSSVNAIWGQEHTRADGATYRNLGKASSSSIRYKNVISQISNEDVQKLFDMPLYWYKYKKNYLSKEDERYDTTIPGFIAEELEKVSYVSVDHNSDGSAETWNHRMVVPLMFQMIKSNHSEIDALKKEVAELKDKIRKLEYENYDDRR